MTNRNPYHEGELEVQVLTGEQAIASKLSSLIQNTVPTRALGFVRQQSVIWIGISGMDGLPCSFPLFGPPGFVNPGNKKQIEINLEANHSIPDLWHSTMLTGKSIACLIIDFSTRSRLRINGVIRKMSETQLIIDIHEAYPNCPKYIRKREIQHKPTYSEFTLTASGIKLNEQTKSMINCSDTAFVASTAKKGADVSHRGGEKGFIKFFKENKILVPDYKGNSMFNTLGNFQNNPHGGITLVDFNQGYYLQLTGKINIDFHNDSSQVITGGTNRFWEMEVLKWYLFKIKSNLEWEHFDYSPYNPS